VAWLGRRWVRRFVGGVERQGGELAQGGGVELRVRRPHARVPLNCAVGILPAAYDNLDACGPAVAAHIARAHIVPLPVSSIQSATWGASAGAAMWASAAGVLCTG